MRLLQLFFFKKNKFPNGHPGVQRSVMAPPGTTEGCRGAELGALPVPPEHISQPRSHPPVPTRWPRALTLWGSPGDLGARPQNTRHCSGAAPPPPSQQGEANNHPNNNNKRHGGEV